MIEADAKQVLSVKRELAPHLDVASALKRLGAIGMRLTVLTSFSQAGMKAQLDYGGGGGLTEFFERQSVGKFVPQTEGYE